MRNLFKFVQRLMWFYSEISIHINTLTATQHLPQTECQIVLYALDTTHLYRILYLKTLTAVKHGEVFPLLPLSLFCRRGGPPRSFKSPRDALHWIHLHIDLPPSAAVFLSLSFALFAPLPLPAPLLLLSCSFPLKKLPWNS